MPQQLTLSPDLLADFCRRHHVRRLALFGSVLRDDFGPESDVDVLVTFAPDAGHSLSDLVDMQAELEAMFGRPVDLVEQSAVVNPFRRHEILRTRQVVYES